MITVRDRACGSCAVLRKLCLFVKVAEDQWSLELIEYAARIASLIEEARNAAFHLHEKNDFSI